MTTISLAALAATRAELDTSPPPQLVDVSTRVLAPATRRES